MTYGVELLKPSELAASIRESNPLVPGLGIAPGPPTGLLGQGFVGKTIISMSIGLHVASGRPLWGAYPLRQGKVLHLDYEQGARVTHTRMLAMAKAMGIRFQELDVMWRSCIYPKVNLGAKEYDESFCKILEGFSLVIIDSLKGITPGLDENSSAIRDRIQVLTRASESTGCTVLLIHHSGKTNPDRPRKEAGRGSSAIFDELQSCFVVTGEKGKPALVSHEKDRETGKLVDDFWITIFDQGDGALHTKRLDSSQVNLNRTTREFDFVKHDVLEVLRDCRIGSKEACMARLGRGTSMMRVQAWNELARDGEIVIKEYDGGLKLWKPK